MQTGKKGYQDMIRFRNDVMTFKIMKLSIMTLSRTFFTSILNVVMQIILFMLSITILSIRIKKCNTQHRCHSALSVIMLSMLRSNFAFN
jgi:hypothetical protein